MVIHNLFATITNASFDNDDLTERIKATLKQKKEYLAGRFASKEAIFKATQDINYLDYAILHGPNGVPYVLHHPEIQISISHSRTIAIAFVEVL